MGSSCTASGAVPRASDPREIHALPLRTWSPLHATPLPTHKMVKIPNRQFNKTNFGRAENVFLSTTVAQRLAGSF